MKTEVHIGDEIMKWLDVNKRSINWLAEKINYDQSNLNKLLKRPHFNSEIIYLISKSVGVNFFEHFGQALLEEKQIR